MSPFKRNLGTAVLPKKFYWDCTMYKLNQYFVPVVFLAILHVLSTTFSIMYSILCPIRVHSNFVIFHVGQGILNVTLANVFLNSRKPVVTITLKMAQEFQNKHTELYLILSLVNSVLNSFSWHQVALRNWRKHHLMDNRNSPKVSG